MTLWSCEISVIYGKKRLCAATSDLFGFVILKAVLAATRNASPPTVSRGIRAEWPHNLQ